MERRAFIKNSMFAVAATGLGTSLAASPALTAAPRSGAANDLFFKIAISQFSLAIARKKCKLADEGIRK